MIIYLDLTPHSFPKHINELTFHLINSALLLVDSMVKRVEGRQQGVSNAEVLCHGWLSGAGWAAFRGGATRARIGVTVFAGVVACVDLTTWIGFWCNARAEKKATNFTEDTSWCAAENATGKRKLPQGVFGGIMLDASNKQRIFYFSIQ